jgi:uncharacterized RDD family membrane protein YckC
MITFEQPTPDLGTERDIVSKRSVAFLIDLTGLAVVLGITTNIAFLAWEPLGFLVLALDVVLPFAYFIYFEAEYGQTIGKMLMDIVVVSEDDGSISYKEATVRTLLRPFDTLGLVAIYVTDRKQRIGDLAADTVVVKTKEKPDPL